MAQLYKRDTVMIDFAQTGMALLAEGKIKAALAADRDAIAKIQTRLCRIYGWRRRC